MAEYARVSIPEALQFDIYTFRLLLINAFVYNASQTQEGRDMVNRFEEIYGEHGKTMDVESLTSIF